MIINLRLLPLLSTSTEMTAEFLWNDSNRRADFLEQECEISVALGTSIDDGSTRALLANIYSIVQNYQDRRNLCIFVFSMHQDLAERKASLNCAFDNDKLPNNIRIINKSIQSDTWTPHIYTSMSKDSDPSAIARDDLDTEYNWFRFYLRPQDVGGNNKVIWLDTDIICQASIAELYDFDLKGHVVAAVVYHEPLHDHLCQENVDKVNKIRVTDKHVSPLDLTWHINAGVMLLDLQEITNQKVLEKWNQLLAIHNESCLWKVAGQADFTLAIRGEFERLPKEWNVGYLGSMPWAQQFFGNKWVERVLNQECLNAKILHWNGDKKPWDTGVKGKQAICSSFWQTYDMVSLQDKTRCLIHKS